VDFDPTIGAEIRKTRPALVIQNDIDNRHSPITIVAAISSQIAGERYPTEVELQPPEGGLTRPSVVLLNQIRSVDKRRLVGRLGRLKRRSLLRVDRALQIALGLVNV
jgi:mRNA interferase MazF